MGKKCAFCDKILERKPKEGEVNFSSRIYCDFRCRIAGQKRNGHWRNDMIGTKSDGKTRYVPRKGDYG